MNLRRLLVLPVSIALAATLAGCGSTGHKKKPDPATEGPKIEDQNNDAAFQAFLSRLRRAVATRDMSVLPGMMTVNFGYNYSDPAGEGAGAFDYWNKNNLWQEVNLVLGEKFIPSSDCMVAPGPEISNPDYNGYIAGLKLVNGAWRFAYFISARDVRQAAAATSQPSR